MFVHWEQAKESEATSTELFLAEALTVSMLHYTSVKSMKQMWLHLSTVVVWPDDCSSEVTVLMLNEYIILDQVGSNSDGLQMKRVFTG